MSKNKLDEAIKTKLAKMSVLVVDDSAFDRELAIAVLKKIGFQHIQTAENGSIAANKLKNAAIVKKPFDLVLLDSKMPTQNGVSLMKWLRYDVDVKNQTVIVTTGTSDENNIRDFIDLGVDNFVIKPVTIEVLETKIFEALAIGIKSAV